MRFAFFLALLAATFRPTPAVADPRRAAHLKSLADAAMVGGDAARALALLQQAHAEDPQPGFIANQGVVLEHMGQYAAAVAAFERYLASDPPAAKRAAAEATVARLRPPVVVSSDPAGASVHFDGRGPSAGVTPLRTRLLAGPHFAELRLDGYRVARPAFQLDPGRGATVQVRLEPAVAPGVAAAVEGAPARRPVRVWGWVATGAGGVALAASALLLAQAFSEADARDAARSRGDYDDHEGAANRLLGATYGLAGMGAIGVGVGLWWLLGDEG